MQLWNKHRLFSEEKKLLYNGYIYIKDKDTIDATYWRCEKRGICGSRMITFRGNSSVKKAPSNHNHASDMASVEAVKNCRGNKMSRYSK